MGSTEGQSVSVMEMNLTDSNIFEAFEFNEKMRRTPSSQNVDVNSTVPSSSASSKRELSGAEPSPTLEKSRKIPKAGRGEDPAEEVFRASLPETLSSQETVKKLSGSEVSGTQDTETKTSSQQSTRIQKSKLFSSDEDSDEDVPNVGMQNKAIDSDSDESSLKIVYKRKKPIVIGSSSEDDDNTRPLQRRKQTNKRIALRQRKRVVGSSSEDDDQKPLLSARKKTTKKHVVDSSDSGQDVKPMKTSTKKCVDVDSDQEKNTKLSSRKRVIDSSSDEEDVKVTVPLDGSVINKDMKKKAFSVDLGSGGSSSSSDEDGGSSSSKGKKKKFRKGKIRKPKQAKKPVEVIEIDSLSSNNEPISQEREEVDVVANLFQHCETISNRLAIRLKGFDILGVGEGEDMISTQEALKLTPGDLQLKEYQLAGLNWLVILYQESLNCILADEMGLGKTIQTMSFLSWLKLEKGLAGPHLIVAPGTTLENWRRELSKWLPDHKVVFYYGLKPEREELAYENQPRNGKAPFDILLTQYPFFERDSCNDDRKFFQNFRFVYTIYDEAHAVRSTNTARYRRLLRLNTERRLLLTGTPVQNSLKEVLALMSFCLPKIFDLNSDQISRYFADEDNATKTNLPELLKPFILRRLKGQVLKQLGPKDEVVELLDMPERQAKVYKEVIAAYRQSVSERSHYFTELRKACNHPVLVRYYFGKDKQSSPDGVDRSLTKVVRALSSCSAFGEGVREDLIYKEIEGYSDWQLHSLALEYGTKPLQEMQLPPESIWSSAKSLHLKKLLPCLVQEGHRFLIFSQWTSILDVLEGLLNSLQIKFLRFDGQTAMGSRQEIIDVYNNDRTIPAMLLSTRAGGMGVNLTSADTVILHDLDFNPSMDRQAEDRVHRIGQTKTVKIYKLVCRETVDQTILEIQGKKKKLDEALLASGSNFAIVNNSKQSKTNKEKQHIKAIMDNLKH